MIVFFKFVGLALIAMQFLCSVTAFFIIAKASTRIATELGSRMSRRDYWRTVSLAIVPGSAWRKSVEASDVAYLEQYRRKMAIAGVLLVAPLITRAAVIGALEVWQMLCA
jgi:hypothetical protein